jgi:uncharacterized repeat protein (TIGR02543 family)
MKCGNTGDSFTVTGNITMYAQWAVVSYTIAFDSQGGSSASPITEPYNTTVTLPASTRAYYIFDGWYSMATGGTRYGGGGDSHTVARNTTMYAHWTGESRTITFDSQFAVPPPITSPYNSTVKLPTQNQTGYTFDGWYTEPAGGGTRYSGSDNYTVTENVTLYAQWSVRKYTVTFNSQGGEAVSPMTDIPYNAMITLPVPAPTFGFNGWYSAATGGTRYGGGSYIVTGNVTMYAQWGTFTITYNSLGGGTYAPRTVSALNTTITLPSPTRGGFTFGGWYSAASGGTRYGGGGDNFTATGNVTLYAHWNGTITFNSNGGSAVSPITAEEGEQITLPTPTQTGFNFLGWYNRASYDSTRYGGGGDSYTVGASTTMYARWTRTPHTVTFDSRGGTAVEPITVLNGSATKLPSITRSEYQLIGWSPNPAASTTGLAGGINYTVTNDVTLYAIWGRTITFNVNKNYNMYGEIVYTGAFTNPVIAVEGTSITLPTIHFSPTATDAPYYYFDGWYDSPSGYITWGMGGASYTVTGNVTLYAQWHKN